MEASVGCEDGRFVKDCLSRGYGGCGEDTELFEHDILGRCAVVLWSRGCRVEQWELYGANFALRSNLGHLGIKKRKSGGGEAVRFVCIPRVYLAADMAV